MDCSDMIPTVVLHWNYRGFTEFPLHLLRGEESEITDIYLKENLISRLPTDIGRLERLESLYLSGNDITLLPGEISKLRALKCLDLSGNRLRSIPDEIGDVRSLKFLILDENELSELPLRIAELRSLRYLSVCDNNLEWLPQRPVFNYHHCELRFWRNKLTVIPFSLWYHMFRDQQTRSFGMGKPQTISCNRPICRLTITNGNGSQNIDIQCPAQHQNIMENVHSPPNLYELCRRRLYQIISDTAKKLTTETQSIYADFPFKTQNMTHNQEDLILNIDNATNIPSEDKNGNYEIKVIPSVFKNGTKRKEKSYYAPSDIVNEHYSFLPNFMKRDLRGGPISRCENVACMKPMFDFVLYEFCLGKPQTISCNRPICRLTITNGNGSQNIDIQCPAQHQNIMENVHSPPNLYELCRRRLYQIISDTAKKLTTETQSIYADFPFKTQNMTHNQEDLILNIDNATNIPSEDKNGNYEIKVIPSVFKNGTKRKEKSYYAPSDIVNEHYSFLPNFMKRDLRGGPISRCENVACMKPMFDFVLYEFCLGDIILIDRSESVILSAAFCSKTCAEVWKRGRTNVIPWTLVQNN